MAVVIKKGNFSDKLRQNIVYLHCVEQNVEVVNIEHLACLSIRVRCAHISYIDMLSVRRLVYVTDDGLDGKLAGFNSPVLVKVSTCCDLKVSTVYLICTMQT